MFPAVMMTGHVVGAGGRLVSRASNGAGRAFEGAEPSGDRGGTLQEPGRGRVLARQAAEAAQVLEDAGLP
jgi:hypothetical protein